MERPLQQWDSRIGRRLRLRDLHILSAVVQWGSMAKAATHLGMTQPAVSEAMAKLEDALRVRLLDRSAKGVEPTIYAHVLLKRSAVVFDELQQGLHDIEFLADPTVGEVRIASAESFDAGLLPAAINALSLRYPKIHVRVNRARGTTLEVWEQLRERAVDLVLARLTGAFSAEDLKIEVLAYDRHYVVAGASSPWAHRRKISLAELVDEPWTFTHNEVIRTLLVAAFKAHGLAVPKERVTAVSMLLRNHLLATGRFLSILPDSVLNYNNKQWGLKILPVDLCVEPWPIVIATLKNRTVSPVVQLFIEHAREAARTMFTSSSPLAAHTRKR